MSLNQYIREDQEFLIFIRSQEGKWEKYDPSRHGAPENLRRGYVVAYLGGEIIDSRENPQDLPPGTHYIEEYDAKPEVMPPCVEDGRISIHHEPSAYHLHGKYCTRIRNTGNIPFKIKKFASFTKNWLFGKFKLSTISNNWFRNDQFMNWYNQKTEWIFPGSEVADQDNYGCGNGFWVYEVEFQTGETVFVKSKLPFSLI